ncbi:DUF1638 domain-containing protein [Sporomusa sp.]|uniref:DUF1638 domain-containing protein n=1 Tax=Sporomusa sp. TaxID=2078658 RepID=UPI002B6750D3|nr:DUF1638 domain-containing protein [Sporomusa sp.]MDF2874064.1 hypothetical protein [Sporomusa sp.]HWR10127.1 DUF1638 domain-containing protein [Sporomusa sp.]
MKICFLACSIYQPELEAVLAQIRRDRVFDCELAVTYLPLRLHVNLKNLKEAVLTALDETIADKIILLYGSKCHPEFGEFLKDHQPVRFAESNCIELILGERMHEIDNSSKTFYLTPGWLMKWRELFDRGWGIDEVELRQSFGYYDKILLFDTGVSEITDEMILEFFEYTRVPIEVEQGGLDVFKSNILAAIRTATAGSA